MDFWHTLRHGGPSNVPETDGYECHFLDMSRAGKPSQRQEIKCRLPDPGSQWVRVSFKGGENVLEQDGRASLGARVRAGSPESPSPALSDPLAPTAQRGGPRGQPAPHQLYVRHGVGRLHLHQGEPSLREDCVRRGRERCEDAYHSGRQRGPAHLGQAGTSE